MVRIKLVIPVLFAIAAFSVVAVSIASAAEWLLNGEPLAGASSVDLSGELRLEDIKGGIFGEAVGVECDFTGKGTVGPGEVDTESEVTVTECVTVKGTCASKPTVTMLNLPWKTFLVSATVDTLGVSSGKEPAYEVDCNLGVKDTCTAESGVSIPLKNLTAMESGNEFNDVDLEFTKAAAEAKPRKCSRGGEKEGLVVGKVLVSDPGGNLSTS